MGKRIFKLFMSVVLIVSMMALQLPVMADETTDASADAFNQKMNALMQVIQTYYYKDINATDLQNGALKGVFESLDPHSTYFTADEMKNFAAGVSGDFGGVGLEVERKNDRITVVAPIEGTPAAKAGLQTGDRLIYVNDTDISNYNLENAVKLIRGEANTKVKLGIQREGVKDIFYIDLVREIIKINPVKYEIKQDNIGYIRISQFNDHTYDNMKKAVDYFKSKDVKGVIIDVRNNPGGLLDQVVKCCQLLIPKGPIVRIKYKTAPEEVYTSELEKAPFKIVMLVNGGSASASEIMAGAVKDSGTGILVGEKTYGKGTVQNILSFLDGSGLKLTIANYLTPSNFSLDGIGLTPNKVVKSDFEDRVQSTTPIKGNRSIKKGLIGLDVLGLQERLDVLGYKVKAEDGIFDTSTRVAVLKFQKANKLKQDASMELNDLKVLESKYMEKLRSQDNQLQAAVSELKKMLAKGTASK